MYVSLTLHGWPVWITRLADASITRPGDAGAGRGPDDVSSSHRIPSTTMACARGMGRKR